MTGLVDVRRHGIFVAMQHARTNTASAIATTRSKVSNGTRLLENVDGRSSLARRFRDLYRAYEAEIGGALNEIDRGLIRQAASLSLRAERMQAAVVRGEEVDNDALIRLSGESRRIMASLRTKATKRRPSGPPSVDDYLRNRQEALA
ncbi:hypothetical protein [Methylocella sp. CPCC 101449]|uniref:hypothetical protein n=1 Tax=Methylocella sp. CPCC 101449 TaxID=2987531 RepID=UPI00288F4DA5|nr:hypothetical protein [Methylocella sp. CPCC 101449]MDT2022816.1 hypothetical protein [Methylocella sp. CPCC 101449]